MPNSASFIELDVKGLAAQAAKVAENMEQAGDFAEKAFDKALAGVAEKILGDAQEAAPEGKGVLRGSGTTVGPEHVGTEISVLIGFNLVYARIRDQGGVIRPVKAKALFIPLRDGVRPGQPGLKLGVDFQLVPGPMTRKTEVKQEGNQYLTGTFEKHRGTVGLEVGRLMRAYLTEGSA